MATKEEVQRFLNQMKEKIKVFGIIYRDDRGKNAQTLIDLEITLGKGSSALCISFHLAEHPMNYPFK